MNIDLMDVFYRTHTTLLCGFVNVKTYTKTGWDPWHIGGDTTNIHSCISNQICISDIGNGDIPLLFSDDETYEARHENVLLTVCKISNMSNQSS